jgi:hypothetical protein
MVKEVLYYYLGTNGSILSPVHLEDAYYTRRLKLTADEGKSLTKDNQTFFTTVTIAENDLASWREV